MTPFLAYLDTNGVTDFSEPRAPVDREMRARLLAAVGDGRIILPLSEPVAQEIAAIAATHPSKADKLGRFYLKIASRDHALPAAGTALGKALAQSLGDPAGPIYASLPPGERKAFELRLSGKARANVAKIAAKYKRDAHQWTDQTRGYRDKARELLAVSEPELRSMPLDQAVAGIWSRMAPPWAWVLVEGRGLLDRAREAKLDDEALLQIPGLRVGVGSAIGLAAAQTINTRLPRPADYGDVQHCQLAACAGLPLVTSDGDLRKLIEAIPGNPLRVISPVELLEQAGC